MPGAGLEPARPLGGHLILSRPPGLGLSRPIWTFPACPTYSFFSWAMTSRPVSVGLAATLAATSGTAVRYLRPSTKFTLLRRASLLPGLGL
jgi:hypothetical protein